MPNLHRSAIFTIKVLQCAWYWTFNHAIFLRLLVLLLRWVGLPLRNIFIGAIAAMDARSIHVPNYAGYVNRPTLAGASEITGGENGTPPQFAIEALESPSRDDHIYWTHVHIQRFVGSGSVVNLSFA